MLENENEIRETQELRESLEDNSRTPSANHQVMNTEIMEMILNDEDNYYFEDDDGSDIESEESSK